MKILIISDTHGHIANIKAVMEIAVKSDIRAVIHCGDWDNKEAAEAVLSYEIPLYCVSGNADVDSDIDEYLKFNAKKYDPFFLKFKLGGRRIGVIHVAKEAFVQSASEMDIVFSGHYHSKEERMVNFIKFVRPGALLNGINFAVYETETNEVHFVTESQS
jgi:putative phosphoesterase